jgi:uncharacterized protein (TIGR02147 family)
MPNIAEYTDHRKFLKDYYEETKAKNPNFSYQVFSEKAGMKSKGFLHNVICGSRDLSKSNVFGLARAMKLNRKESEYFENLVAFNLAESLDEKKHYYERLFAAGNQTTSLQARTVCRDQYEFYSQWYHSVVRSLIDLRGFHGDYEQLARSVFPRIRPLQAKKSVELLVKLGLVKKGKDGSFSVVDKCIATPREVLNLAIANFHREMGSRALEALNALPLEKRNFSAMTLGISEAAYKEICEDIYALRRKILEKTESDTDAHAVYQLNFQFFPVSIPDTEGKR